MKDANSAECHGRIRDSDDHVAFAHEKGCADEGGQPVNGGLIGQIQYRAWLTVDAHTERLELEVSASVLEQRRAGEVRDSAENLSPVAPQQRSARRDRSSLGRSLFDAMRSQLSAAEDGACAW